MIYIIQSNSNIIYENLAMEQCLRIMVQESKGKVGVLFLWQNENCVVIGRSQNMYTQVKIDMAKQLGTLLARRMTGGGAVYQDMGNLCFTMILPKELYDLKKSDMVIEKACKSLGLNVDKSGRNDFLLKGAKFSGSAYFCNESVGMHHGTIMLDVDCNRMEQLLQVDRNKLIGNGIESVRCRVCNLRNVISYIQVKDVVNVLKQGFLDIYSKYLNCLENEAMGNNGREEQLCDVRTCYVPDKRLYQNMLKHFYDYNWIIGEMPNYTIKGKKKFQWGMVTIFICLSRGIKKVTIESDSLFPEFMEYVQRCLNNGITFREMKKAVSISYLKMLDDLEILYESISNSTAPR